MTEKKPTAMLIEVNFDIDQVGQTPEWRFSRKDGQGKPIKGRYAGSVYFTVGEKTRLRLRAGSYAGFSDFQVLDCTLITLPQVVQIGGMMATRFAPPSPFVSNAAISVAGASVSLPGEQFVNSPVQPHDPEYNELALEWEHNLTVGESTGRWEIAFVVTVQFTRANGLVEQRVFSFDPEGEVGTGVSPPKVVSPPADEVMPPVAMTMLMPEGEVGTGVSPPK